MTMITMMTMRTSWINSQSKPKVDEKNNYEMFFSECSTSILS